MSDVNRCINILQPFVIAFIDRKPVHKGYLNVSNASAAKVDKSESGKDFSFRLRVGNEDIYLACSNDKDIDMWIDALNYCSEKVMLSPRRRSSSKPDRAFFLDSPTKRDLARKTPEKVDVEEVTLELDKCTLIQPTPSDEDVDRDTNDNDDIDDDVSSVTNLSIKIISTDGVSTPMPNFNELVRDMPITPLGNNVSPTVSKDCTSDDEPLDPPEDEFPPLEPRFQEILVDASDFIIDTELGVCGTGAFGTVYKATRKSDNKVFALKFFGYAKRDPQNLDILETEIDVMLKLKGSEVFAQIECFFYDTYEGLVPNKKFIDSYPGMTCSSLTYYC